MGGGGDSTSRGPSMCHFLLFGLLLSTRAFYAFGHQTVEILEDASSEDKK